MRLELRAFKELCRDLAALAGDSSQPVRALVAEANAELVRRAIDFGGLKQLKYTPTSFVITQAEHRRLNWLGRRLHGLVEHVLNLVAAGDEQLLAHFARHEPFRPFLMKSRRHWQGFSRYDTLITPAGDVKFIELNTSCPSSFYYQRNFNEVLWAHPLGFAAEDRAGTCDLPSDDPTYFARALAAMEEEAGFAPKAVAVLYDESKLILELEQFAESFQRIGRDAFVADARDCEYRDGKLWVAGKEVSMTYNKFRLLGIGQHHWAEGFESRYDAFLRAARANAFLPVNNFAAMAYGEDKGMLAVFTDPAFAGTFSPDDWEFLQRHVPWTRRTTEKVMLGRAPNGSGTLRDHVLRNRERYVLKPANDGRGQKVTIGRYVSDSVWAAAVGEAVGSDYVLQESVDMLLVPVVREAADGLRTDELFHTASFYFLDDIFSGIFSRVSANPVTNLAVDGMMQPVVVLKDEPVAKAAAVVADAAAGAL